MLSHCGSSPEKVEIKCLLGNGTQFEWSSGVYVNEAFAMQSALGCACMREGDVCVK